jgi:trk system potassium uptake protein TrkA
MSRKATRNFAVIGLGSFGSTIARELARFGNYVAGIDRDPVVINRMAEHLSQTFIADGTDDAALKEIGIGDYDVAVIAMGEDLESSVVSAISVRMAGVGEVWAKAVSRTHHRILSKIGVDRIVNPEEEMGRHVAQMLNNPMVRDYVTLGNGYHVVNMIVPERLAGRTLDSLDLRERFELRCVGVMGGTEFKGGDGARCALAEDDRLILLGRRADLRRFADTV